MACSVPNRRERTVKLRTELALMGAFGALGLDYSARYKPLTDDFYQLKEDAFALRGRHKGRVFRLGDEVEVELKSADSLHRQVDLVYCKHRGGG